MKNENTNILIVIIMILAIIVIGGYFAYDKFLRNDNLVKFTDKTGKYSMSFELPDNWEIEDNSLKGTYRAINTEKDCNLLAFITSTKWNNEEIIFHGNTTTNGKEWEMYTRKADFFMNVTLYTINYREMNYIFMISCNSRDEYKIMQSLKIK
jgi:hypothetical protein